MLTTDPLGFGSNESGAEFGEGNLPGVLGTDYTWPDTDKIQTLIDGGMNIFRVPFLMERLCPDGMAGSADSTYMGDLKSVGTPYRMGLVMVMLMQIDCELHHQKRSLCYRGPP